MAKRDISLLVLAAGMGSRYGGLKQLDELGPDGETILEYSIYDAIKAGFSKVVFVVRDFFKDEFEKQIGEKFKDRVEIAYVCQEVNPDIPGFEDLPTREKPWGTSHAVLVAKDCINEPFAVINADDYYGQACFETIAQFLTEEVTPSKFAMVGYILENTLSEQGHVNRGVCSADENGNLKGIKEILKIRKNEEGDIIYGEHGETGLQDNDPVSMNFWGFHQDIFAAIEKGFHSFVEAHQEDLRAEYYIPIIVDDMINDEKATVKLLTSDDHWYGVTYKEDAEVVKAALMQFAEEGKYPRPLWKRSV